jgi:hypothetical protein
MRSPDADGIDEAQRRPVYSESVERLMETNS